MFRLEFNELLKIHVAPEVHAFKYDHVSKTQWKEN